jgi:hypothetical protein
MTSRFLASKFAIGDKVDQAFSNHAEGAVVAVFDSWAGEHCDAIEMFGHRTIEIAAEGSWSCTAIVPASPALRSSRPLRQFIPDAAIR